MDYRANAGEPEPDRSVLVVGPRGSQPLKGAGLGRIALGYPGNVAQVDDRGDRQGRLLR